ncbi:MAG: bacterial transcriptional activator domain-containing protein [Chromatiales bacterium]
MILFYLSSFPIIRKQLWTAEVAMNVDALKKMLESGQDNLLLRFGLGQTLLKQGDSAEAIEHLQKAVEFDPQHSAAWKLLGKALAVENHQSDAINAYEQGIRVAEDKGDIQAAKEMKVFLKRLQKDAD